MVSRRGEAREPFPDDDTPEGKAELERIIAENASIESATEAQKEEAKAIATLALSFQSWDDVSEHYGELETVGDFELADDKHTLIGREFVVLGFIFRESDKVKRQGVPAEYVTVYIMTKDSDKLVFNDGGTGIPVQLREIKDRTGKTGGIYCKRGLRVSRYDYTDDKGDTTEAETFYLT